MSIANTFKTGLGATVRFLNHPFIKEGVKNVAGVATFAFGLIEVYDLYQIARGREISTDLDPTAPKWVQTVTKVAIVCSKISLIISGAVSRPGVYIISTLIGRIFSTQQLNRVFGPNAPFVVNPWHPRHLFSFAGVILAVPDLSLSMCKGIFWMYRKIRHYQTNPSVNPRHHVWLTDTMVRLMTVFNTLTSRPTLHIGNRLARLLS